MLNLPFAGATNHLVLLVMSVFDDSFANSVVSVNQAPEPGGLALVAAGLALVSLTKRRRRQ